MKKIVSGIAGITLLVLLIVKLSSFKASNTEWVAVHVIDNGSDTLRIDNDKIKIAFQAEEYTFYSTLNQKETGRFQQKGKSLILSPNGSSSSYKVEIISAAKDGLILEMAVDQSVRQLVMKPLP